tara:strand:- start:482 stop:622 length:141 start_codon:yes stop_codon:yes gene_type:complete
MRDYKVGNVIEEEIYRKPFIRWCDEEKETKQVLRLRIYERKNYEMN